MESLPSAEGQELDPLAQTPQWVILGIETQNGVGVLASARLTRAQLSRKFEDVKVSLGTRTAYLRKEKDAVLIECEGFSIIYGDTYRDCMLSLPDIWQPPPEPQRAIDAGS